MVEHTHDNIDASFGCWSMKLHEEGFPIIPLLVKCYINLDIVLIIPHSKVLDLKVFIKPFNFKEGDC